MQAQLPDRGAELRGSEPGVHQEPGGLDSLGQGLGQPLEGQLYFGPSRRFKVPGQIAAGPAGLTLSGFRQCVLREVEAEGGLPSGQSDIVHGYLCCHWFHICSLRYWAARACPAAVQ